MSARCWTAVLFLLAAGLPAADLRPVPSAPRFQGRTLATLTVAGDRANSPAMAEGRVLVAFRAGISEEDKRELAGSLGGAFRSSAAGRPFDVLELAGDDLTVADAVAALQADPRVRIAEPDYLLHALDTIPNDPRFPTLWGLSNRGQGTAISNCTGCSKAGADISAVKAWDITTGSENVIVGVIDSGVDYTHPDLAANILRDAAGKVIGWDAANQDDDPMDDYGHGTHCAGIIGATGNNGEGVTGVCWKVKIMPLKFLDDEGSGPSSAAIECIDYAVAHGAHILSNSWGGGSYSQLLLEAIRRAESKGVLFVASAGNSALNVDTRPSYPASYNRYLSNVISVAATDYYDLLASYSNYGPNTCDIAAPGSVIYSTLPTGACPVCSSSGYGALSGTSMAAPYVAGAAGLIKAAYPDSTIAQLRARLLYSADRPPEMDGYTRYGRLNAFRSVQADTVAPGAPTAFAVTAASSTGFRLSWIAAGDNGADGTVAGYRVLYDTAAEMPAPQSVNLTLNPGAPGTRETVDLTGLLPGTAYWVRLVAIDKAGNESAPVTAGPVSTGAAVFADGAESEPRLESRSDPLWVVADNAAHTGTHSWASPARLPLGVVARLSMRDYFTVSRASYVSLWVKREIDSGDTLSLVVTDKTTGWESYTPFNTGSSGWEQIRVDLTPYVGNPIRVSLDFMHGSNSAGLSHRVWVDDVAVVELTRGMEDDMEGAAQFTGFPSWSVTEESASSGTHAWSDSPGGNYANNTQLPLMQNASAALPDGFGSPVVSFRARIDLEPSRDYLQVYASRDDGDHWESIGSLTGKAGWSTYSIPLPGWKKVRLLFVLSTNEAIARDGVYLDDIGIWGEMFAPLP